MLSRNRCSSPASSAALIPAHDAQYLLVNTSSLTYLFARTKDVTKRQCGHTDGMAVALLVVGCACTVPAGAPYVLTLSRYTYTMEITNTAPEQCPRLVMAPRKAPRGMRAWHAHAAGGCLLMCGALILPSVTVHFLRVASSFRAHIRAIVSSKMMTVSIVMTTCLACTWLSLTALECSTCYQAWSLIIS